MSEVEMFKLASKSIIFKISGRAFQAEGPAQWNACE